MASLLAALMPLWVAAHPRASCGRPGRCCPRRPKGLRKDRRAAVSAMSNAIDRCRGAGARRLRLRCRSRGSGTGWLRELHTPGSTEPPAGVLASSLAGRASLGSAVRARAPAGAIGRLPDGRRIRHRRQRRVDGLAAGAAGRTTDSCCGSADHLRSPRLLWRRSAFAAKCASGCAGRMPTIARNMVSSARSTGP